MTQEITTLQDLRATVVDWRGRGQRIALVPTMGALHAGHLALVKRARAEAQRVVVSIFVNPTQFGPGEDFSNYPRTLADDLAALREAGADAAWLPDAATMYPEGFASSIHVAGISEILEGAIRPGHFDGVATVVAKLFQQVQPDLAIFGEKDYQQLCLIKRLVKDLDMNISIIAAPIERDVDGLALSSRNRYLDEKQRGIAPQLNRILRHWGALLREGAPVAAALKQAQQELLLQGFDQVDYVALCDSETLAPLAEYRAPARLLAAARLGNTRLIDNIAV